RLISNRDQCLGGPVTTSLQQWRQGGETVEFTVRGAHPEVAAAHYPALRENDPGRDIQRKLLRYIPERAANRARFEGALAGTGVALSFLWGMRDPVSGAAIAEELRNRMPGADLVEYGDAGHCPHIEIPDRVAADLLKRTGPTVGGCDGSST